MQLAQVQLTQVNLVQILVHGMLQGTVGNAGSAAEVPGVAICTSRSN